jgi:hypothetical protein
MNPNGAALLTNPHPCGHIVYPYTDEGLVGQAVCLFASAGLRNQEGVVLIITHAHCEPIKLRLQMEGFNIEALERSGQLVCADAEDLLRRFVNDRRIDEDVFKSVIGGLILHAKASVNNGHPAKVRVFGEMVSQLRHTDVTATNRLEELWNEVIDEHSVALLCTYAMHDADDHIPASLIALHSHNIERESSVAQNV